MELKKNARIGIWGYGIVGKAAVDYFSQNGYKVNVMDKRTFTPEELHTLEQKKCAIFIQEHKNHFFTSHDYLFSSPGVNIANDYATHKHKWLTELDLFSSLMKKPIISITGSIGKTSVTTMISSLLRSAHISVCTGGNIGIATLDLLAQKNHVDYAVLEVSSFQLQYCKTFAPHLAIITNIYPNHLDHHATEEEYFLAKYNNIAHQTHNDYALINLSLRDKCIKNAPKSQLSFFAEKKPTMIAQLRDHTFYYADNNMVIRYHNNTEIPLLSLTSVLLSFSFLENIVMLAAACDILQIPLSTLYGIPGTTQLPEHRLEKVATINGIDFYNDSKSTTTISTLAAVEKLKDRPLHLFLGGLSKGVNREPFIAQLKNTITHIYCFGKEAQELHTFCAQNTISSTAFVDLEEAFYACIKNIQSGDNVLLSPAGSSYDLYSNFEERGKHFKKLITKLF